MICVVNGEEQGVDEGCTVATLVTSYVASAKGVAVACNGDIVPRSAWEMTEVRAGDRVEILSAARGG